MLLAFLGSILFCFLSYASLLSIVFIVFCDPKAQIDLDVFEILIVYVPEPDRKCIRIVHSAGTSVRADVNLVRSHLSEPSTFYVFFWWSVADSYGDGDFFLLGFALGVPKGSLLLELLANINFGSIDLVLVAVVNQVTSNVAEDEGLLFIRNPLHLDVVHGHRQHHVLRRLRQSLYVFEHFIIIIKDIL